MAPASAAYPVKPDDDTVDSSDESPPSSASPSKSKEATKNRLTMASRMYDLDGDGVLDEAERAMRDADAEGRGYLTNEEIYDIVQEQLAAKRRSGQMKKLIFLLATFIVVLAIANLGTSLAAAILAKDLVAENDDDSSVMTIKETGEVAAAQTTAEVYEADPLTEEEFESRRLMVLAEIEADPHSHAHRRDLSGKKGRHAGHSRITFDTRVMPEEEFTNLQRKCQQNKNVYIKQRWGTDTRNNCVCSRGTSVVVRAKKSKDKNRKPPKVVVEKTVVKGRKPKNRVQEDKYVILERPDGGKMHADCVDGSWYVVA